MWQVGERMSKEERIAVVGCGHVGAVYAACLADLGHHVTGVDINQELVNSLNSATPPFLEPGLPELLQRHGGGGRLRFVTSYEDALDRAGFVFLCVNTPATITGAADLRYVRRAVSQIGEVLSRTQSRPFIVNKSTSPIGTGETIDAILGRAFAGSQNRPAITANPEFTREGSAVYDFFHPDRIVIGSEDPSDAGRVAALYEAIECPVIITDLRTAELIKYVSNAFLATKVSFINEIALLCERLGVDVDLVAHGAALDHRIGDTYFQPGVGYGGSCLPKDVAALHHTGESVGVTMRVIQSVQDVNVSQRKHVVNSIRTILGPLEGLTIGALGATFKGGSEDLRDSPALDIIELLRNEGAYVQVYDPALTEGSAGGIGDRICRSALEAAAGADCTAVLTDWPEFGGLDLTALREAMRGKLVYDGRNVLDRASVEAAGFLYHGVGRPLLRVSDRNGRSAK